MFAIVHVVIKMISVKFMLYMVVYMRFLCLVLYFPMMINDFEVFVECCDSAGVIIAKMKSPVHTSSDDYARNKILSWIDSSLRGIHQGKTNRLLISFNVPDKGFSLPLNMVNDVY